MITTLDTLSWGEEIVTGNSEFVETSNNILYVVSNVRDNGFGFGRGFGSSFASSYSFVVLQSDPVPPAPGPGATFGGIPPASVPVATYTFPQPTTSFDPVCAYDETTGLLHILGARSTPINGTTASIETNDLIKFTYDTVGHTLSGPFVIGASVASRVRGAYDIGVLNTGNTLVAAALTDPSITMPPLAGTITAVSITENIVTLSLQTMSTPFVENQWILVNNLTNATFLNGQLLRVATATPNTATAVYVAADYPTTAEPLTTPPPSATAVGSSLFAVELDKTTNQPVPDTAAILASSPSRTGDTYDGVSLVINGPTVDLYYQAHPKQVTFKDQSFTIYHVGRNSSTLSGFGLNFGNYFGQASAGFGYNFGNNFGYDTTVLYTFSARYTDNRLTVVQDQSGNKYMTLTYWTQLNHPQGVIGNVLMGVQQGTQPWFFHPTAGTTAGGSIVQSVVSVARNGAVNLAYLLQPFVPVTNPPSDSDLTASYPLRVATVDPTTLGLTDVPGFYNTTNFTWLRGTKSSLDNGSVWGLVGQQQITAIANNELQVIPATGAPEVLVNYAPSYFENEGVVYFPSLIPLVEVAVDPPGPGQYTVEESIGLYKFNPIDAGRAVAISYEYVSAIQPVYASLFNVPPVAQLAPLAATVWRNGTYYATDVVSVTGFSVTSNVITIFCTNDFLPGQRIALYGFAHATNNFLNGVVLTVNTATTTQFTANFTHPDTPLSPVLNASAAALIPGSLTLSAAGSVDADKDAMQYIWTENDPNVADVYLTPNGAQATLHVLGAAGAAQRNFNVGVAVIDLFPDLVTQRHPALVLHDIEVSSGTLTLTFTAPAGAIVPITGEQIMLYNVVLQAPPQPVLSVVQNGFGYQFGVLFGQNDASGFLPVQGAPGWGFQFGAQFGIVQPISVIITYVNSQGETIGSTNSTIASVDANALLEVISPVPAGGAGDAFGYNVYVGAVGQETLQPNHAGIFVPTPLGTNWIEPVTGIAQIGVTPPLVSGATQEFLNNKVLTVTATTPTTISTAIPFGFGATFGFDFGVSAFPQASVTGAAISQYQFAQTSIVVPANTDPIVTFPYPAWQLGNVLTATVPRNTKITITPFEITEPTTEFPIVYTGLTDPDDVPTYQWTQISGTPLVLPKGSTSPALVIDTSGVNLSGETIGFSLTIGDGINASFTADFSFTVAAYVFNPVHSDTLQVSRSVYSTSADILQTAIKDGFATFVTSPNAFTAGQRVWFSGMTAVVLNGAVETILPTGFGQGYGANFGSVSLNSTSFMIYDPSLTNYAATPDTGIAYSPMGISQRNDNVTSAWSPLDISILYNNLQTIKRNSVLDGTDRYILISPYSVLVYGVFSDRNPSAVLLRKIFLPDSNRTILDAVHTEQDYTLVLDDIGNIYRYSTSAFINTDNPDTILSLANYSSLDFSDTDLDKDVHILTTVNFANQRVLVISGEQGALLLQVNTTTLGVTGAFELTVASNFVYGANKVQFVRWVNMDNLTSGRILLGTILNKSAAISNIAITSNALTVTCQNTFFVGDMITFSGLTNATFLNGITLQVVAVTPTTFTAALTHADYPLTADTGQAQSQTSGNTYETLLDLKQQQIVGTFDKSKLRNQFVETGEIMFAPDDPYAGGPTAPTLLPITTTTLGGNTNIVLTWEMVRPDLINFYTIQMASEKVISVQVPVSAPFTIQIAGDQEFTGDAGVFDGTVNANLKATSQTSPLDGQYHATPTGLYTFSPAQAGHNVAITIRQAFNTFQVVPVGSVLSIMASVPLGSTYFFRVEASGVDGTSDFSNIQSISL